MINMRRIIVSVLSAVLFPLFLRADDSALFNAFIDAGMPVVLEQGRVYHLSSDIHSISSDDFAIRGNGAKVVIDKDFPLDRYERVFEFSSQSARKSFVVTDIDIVSELGQKFDNPLDAGDTFIFDIDSVRYARFENVRITDAGRYNNLTYIVAGGVRELTIRDCEFHSASLSSQGGAVWIMNENADKVSAEFSNVVFDFDDRDECMCFGVSDRCNIDKCQMTLNVNDCVFTTNGDCPSSGFVMSYNQSPETVADIRLNYNSCKFVSRGRYSRRIQSYQASEYNHSQLNSFISSYEGCYFIFHSPDDDSACLTGLLPDDSAVHAGNIRYSFKRCNFDIDRCILADRMGWQKGTYTFEKCSIVSSGNALVKNFNYGHGTIIVEMYDTSVLSDDIFACSETTIARNCNFKHLSGRDVRPQRASMSNLITPSTFRNCNFNGKKLVRMYSAKNARVIVDRYSTYQTISELMYNEVIPRGSLNSLAVYLKKKLPVSLNGKRISLSYLAEEGNFFAGINLSDLRNGKNQFIFGDEILEFYYK